jgi:hypothetical protein
MQRERDEAADREDRPERTSEASGTEGGEEEAHGERVGGDPEAGMGETGRGDEAGTPPGVGKTPGQVEREEGKRED